MRLITKFLPIATILVTLTSCSGFIHVKGSYEIEAAAESRDADF